MARGRSSRAVTSGPAAWARSSGGSGWRIGSRCSARSPDVARLLHAGDVFVLPTLYDPMPNAALEAIACGLPVVTTPDAGIGDVVIEHGAGCLSGRGAEALSCAIEETFADLEARRRAAIGLRDRFDLSRATARWLDLYRERL